MSKTPLPLYEPLNTLKPIADNVWIADGGMIEMDAVVTKLPFSTRMTVIRLANGQLWCHSPIAPNAQLFEECDALGKVAHLVSSNKIHYAYVADWKKRYPSAIAWSSPGVEERARQQNIPVTFDQNLMDEAPTDWASEIDQLIVKGSSRIQEVVFFHKNSRTLIVTDLIENFEVNKMTNPVRKFLYKLSRIAAPDGQTPIDHRMTFSGHQAQARASLERMLSWKPEKIILAHGRCFLENGTAELRRSLRWIKLR